MPTDNSKPVSTRGGGLVFKGISVLLVMSVIGGVVYFGALMEAVAGVYSNKIETRPFEQGLWKASLAIESSDSDRLRMIDDLMENHLEAGMHESKLHQLLGFPDPYEPFAGYDFMYYLGAGPAGADYDSVWLVFKLNTRGEVQFFKVATD